MIGKNIAKRKKKKKKR